MKHLRIHLTLFLIFTLFISHLASQSIQSDHLYWLVDGAIYDYDPVSEKYKAVGINPPTGASGLAIAKHPALGNPFTFFTTVGGFLYYYTGTKWINTEHSSGSVNIAGANKYIFALDGINSRVYRYDFNGDAKILFEMESSFAGPYDLVCDQDDNFYILHTLEKVILMYNSSGGIIGTIPISDIGTSKSGGGIAVVNGKIYALTNSSSQMGDFNLKQINFVSTGTIPFSLNDFANFPFQTYSVDSLDTNLTSKHGNAYFVSFVPDFKDIHPNELQSGKLVSMLGRGTEVQDSIIVTDKKIHFVFSTPYPKDKVRITAGYNGNMVMENLFLGGDGLVSDMVYGLPANWSYLVVDAVKSKDDVPVTVDIKIVEEENGKVQTVRLNSSYNNSGAVKIFYKHN